ncbi:GntR family transcriptional regulator [Marinobacter sp. M3C]|jgi:DNA-binding GntR family transcriptional regulator|uniref:GntR family transcriptional regulator n=1 Tax=Marinobacter sp. M3C TaxID=2917715 RepID=UPI00200C08B0|nr:GntR family transcriptional regulator [Marinobacter sp. M3C]MCL1482464.1 GntR family transcriptional regulator [Marinobacter sp.]MCL1488612.1 GntR family transcriptional regulator [Marinobacter sp.]UQG60095.1 GntR family transcriptional regulator [Marinobacter sp. M3C]
MTHGTSTQAAVSAIVSALEQEVIFGLRLPKQRIYEDELIARFDTKRHMVRAALQELERKGIVERVPNRGTVVRFFSREEVQALYVLRQILHEAAARLVTMPADALWLDSLKLAQREHARAVQAQDLSAIFHCNNTFHRTLFEGTGNKYLVEAIEFSNAKSHGIRSHGFSTPSLQAQAVQEHIRMIEAIEIGDHEALVQLCKEHMRAARQFYEEKYCLPSATP